MGLIIKDRVRDTSTSTGTGDLTVSGTAPTGSRTLSAVMSASDTTVVCIQHQTADEWEVCEATYSGSNVIARGTLLSSSTGSRVDFSAGTKDVWVDFAADKVVDVDRVQTLKNKTIKDYVPRIASRTDLASADSTNTPTVFLAESGREGSFSWDSSDLSAEVTADTQQAFYVPPSSDTTGASGCWVRDVQHPALVSWFGAVGDGTTDDYTALQAAADSHRLVLIDEKTYGTSKEIAYSDGTKFIGAGGHWKFRDGFADDEGVHSTFKYIGTISDWQTTSTTSWAPAVESKTFTVDAGKSFVVGDTVTIRRTTNGERQFGVGKITAYSSTSLTVNVLYAKSLTSAGPFNNWTISKPICVVRVSAKPIGEVYSDLTAPGTDDLVNYIFRDIHLDANGADYGLYMFRCGYNPEAVSGITVEDASRAGILGLGLYAFHTGWLGVFSNQNVGIRLGIDEFAWAGKHTVFASTFKVIATGNGLDETWVEDDQILDFNGCGIQAAICKGSKLTFSSELNYGRSIVVGPHNNGGRSFYDALYTERNGAGPCIRYNSNSSGIIYGHGFNWPDVSSDGGEAAEDIKIRAEDTDGVSTSSDAGPANEDDYLRIVNIEGRYSGSHAFAIDSNTTKFYVENSTNIISYTGSKPYQKGVFCQSFFKADSTLSDTRSMRGGTLARTATGRYTITFNQAQPVTDYSILCQALEGGGRSIDVEIFSQSQTAIEIRTYTKDTTTLVDSGKFLNLIVARG